MNGVEYVIGSTEERRTDVVRCVRQLRCLDERIEFHMHCLRMIVSDRQHSLSSTSTRRKHPARCPLSRRGEASSEETEEAINRKRARTELRELIEEREYNSMHADWCCAPQARESTEGSIGVIMVPLGDEREGALREMFRCHKALVQRHVKERERLAAEVEMLGKQIHAAAVNQLEFLESAQSGSGIA